uniref:Uncharacterized protein n=1 Tax=Geospiza parvula TaxID=87175 RepID=A0A8U8C1A4_GEOPR
MNILPKKSWHVRNKDNVARVRRDEAAAEVERRKRDARALRAEQEVRTELLRKRARVGGRSPPPRPPPCCSRPPRRNLMKTRGDFHWGGSHLESPSPISPQERRERALGVLTYLGQSAAEAQTCPPWYLQPPRKAGEGSREVQGGPKAVLDPLQDMRKGLHRAPSPTKPPQLAELRRQRRAREAAEAARSRELLRGLREPRGDPREPRDPRDPERQRPYNSQFHPRLARGGHKVQLRARNPPGTPPEFTWNIPRFTWNY